jgi:hypothetical protein
MAPDGQGVVDLEDLHGQMSTLYALAQREVQQYGGTMQQEAIASWRCLVHPWPKKIMLSGPCWPLSDCASASLQRQFPTVPRHP